jgi:hypothetical protein
MLNENQPLVLVQFEEHPFSRSRNKSSSDHIILLPAGFTMADYCHALFDKVMTIRLSVIHAFLRYQCKLVKDPLLWINTLEKLIKDNKTLFDNDDLLFRRHKFISQFDVHRHRLESEDLISNRALDLSEIVNGFTDKREYVFSAVLEHCNTLDTAEEKIAYLQDQVYEYRQNPPKFIRNSGKAFDELCLSEIDHIKDKEEILLKAALKRRHASSPELPVEKIQITGKLNFFVEIFYQLMHEVTFNGRSFLLSSDRQIAEIINRNFLDRNGKVITIKSVMTILEKNRPEKRPKNNKRFNLGEDAF